MFLSDQMLFVKDFACASLEKKTEGGSVGSISSTKVPLLRVSK